MEPKRILYPLLLLTCIQLSVVIAAFRNSKKTFVANVEHQQLQRKVNGRRRSHIATVYGGAGTYDHNQKRGAEIERNAKTFVANDEHSGISRTVKGRHKAQFKPIAGVDKTKRNPKQPIQQKHDEKEQPPKASAASVTDSPKATTESVKQGNGNGSKSNNDGEGWGKTFPLNTANFVDTKTAFFILMGVTVLVIGCFVFRILRSRSRRKTKKYGILATRGSEVELTPLDQEEDDEDMTVFDANSK